MPASRIRIDFEQMNDVSRSFEQQGNSLRATIQSLKQNLGVLQAGDWVGSGADKFYQEMDAQVLPAVQHLAGALEEAARTTTQISRVMQQAETGAARVLAGNGARFDTMSSGSASPAPARAPAGPGSAAGPVGGAATPQDFGAATRKNLDAIRSGFGDEMAAAAATGMVRGLAGAKPDYQAAAIDALQAGAPPGIKTAIDQALNDNPAIKADVQRGHEDAAVDHELAPFSQGVRDLAKRSPTLRAQLLQAQDRRKTFVNDVGSVSGGQIVAIEQGNGDAETVQHIAHELGHVTSNRPDVIRHVTNETRAEFVAKNVRSQLEDEGAAQFNGAVVRDELLAARGPDISIAGVVHPASSYLDSYAEFKSGAITKEMAVLDMAGDFADEPISVEPHISHRDMYTRRFEQYWDEKVEPFLPH